MVQNLYYCSLHFDLKFWTIDNFHTKEPMTTKSLSVCLPEKIPQYNDKAGSKEANNELWKT